MVAAVEHHDFEFAPRHGFEKPLDAVFLFPYVIRVYGNACGVPKHRLSIQRAVITQFGIAVEYQILDCRGRKFLSNQFVVGYVGIVLDTRRTDVK